MENTILSLQLGKNALNLLPCIFLHVIQNKTIFTSLLILMITDALVTGFLVFFWLTGWPLSLGLEMVALRFLYLQNETYRCVSVLLTMLAFSEEWTRAHFRKCADIGAAEQAFLPQCSLLSLACWMIAISNVYPVASTISVLPTMCNNWDWHCLFTFLSDFETSNKILPCIGGVLSITLLCGTLQKTDLVPELRLSIWRKPRIFMISVLSGTFAAVFFWFLPPFLAVGSWSAFALETCYSILRTQHPESLSTVHPNEEFDQPSITVEKHHT
ncbi:uncharacterized protein XB22041731.S [Xenopus laevis]|uniref:Uncharacterized protein XB22041731.S n=2 Tax=Xenopus laevis TaxID=8355 RepID=A0A1L8HPG0_XENLA|nr:uncharacterized protein XB22041731.S [Xenopus laevis]XP_018099389.1 uncharacterized protein XB22041731.S [Xenopus laevis]XP_018099390.1 uncharacterized protein XB22041731.S [Xenopus laevis]OCT97983.1 hypothetical protein XELAEV_18010211mg [Xenopus laevis]